MLSGVHSESSAYVHHFAEVHSRNIPVTNALQLSLQVLEFSRERHAKGDHHDDLRDLRLGFRFRTMQRTLHNDEAPASSCHASFLPPEVVERIFLNAMDREDARRNLSLGYICRQWRHIAIHCSTLWTSITADIQTTDPLFVSTIIHRSSYRALNVRLIHLMDVPPTPSAFWHSSSADSAAILHLSNPIITLILLNLSRVQSLSLTVSQTVCTIYSKFLAVSAPNLRKLTINVTDDLSQAAGDVSALDTPTLMHLPALTTLELRGFHPLRALKIAQQYSDTIQSLTVRTSLEAEADVDSQTTLQTALLDLIASSPALQNLDLCASLLPCCPAPQCNVSDVISCPALQNLSLAGEVTQFTWFLQNVGLSQTTTIDLAIAGQLYVSSNDYLELGHLLRGIFSQRQTIRGSDAPFAVAMCSACATHDNCYPSVLHFMLCGPEDLVEQYYNPPVELVGDDARLIDRNFEAALDTIRARSPHPRSRPSQRSLHIWMRNTLSTADHIQSLWNTLDVDSVQTLFLNGVPTETNGWLTEATRLSAAFMKYAACMLSVRRIVTQGWERHWLKNLLFPHLGDYPDVGWLPWLMFPALKSFKL